MGAGLFLGIRQRVQTCPAERQISAEATTLADMLDHLLAKSRPIAQVDQPALLWLRETSRLIVEADRPISAAIYR